MLLESRRPISDYLILNNANSDCLRKVKISFCGEKYILTYYYVNEETKSFNFFEKYTF